MKKFLSIIIIVCLFAAVAPAAACTKKSAERTSYEIEAVYDDEAGTLTAQCTVNFLNNTGTALDCIEFNLYANAYRQDALYKPVSEVFASKAYYAGTSYGDMQITAVEGASSWEVCGEDMNILSVSLADTLENNASATVAISYTITLAEVNHRTGITEHTVNLGNFYPIVCAWADGKFYESVYYSDGDPFVSECADYSVKITMPDGYTAASSGSLEESYRSDGNVICSYKLENARDFALVLSDEFKTLTAQAGNAEVTYYYFNDDAAQSKLDAAVESLEFFAQKFGDYVYPTLAVVQTGFAAGGMEYPALTMINGELDEENAIYTIVHENAHQWWYAMVGNDQIENAWQDEGLAEYSSVLFFENYPDYGFTRTGLVNSAITAYRAYFTVYNQIFGDADTSMNRNLKDFVSDYEYVNIAYNKGIVLFDMLRSSIGDDKFYEGLVNYYKNCLYTIATPEELIQSFQSTGVDVQSFFESFIQGKIVI